MMKRRFKKKKPATGELLLRGKTHNGLLHLKTQLAERLGGPGRGLQPSISLIIAYK